MSDKDAHLGPYPTLGRIVLVNTEKGPNAGIVVGVFSDRAINCVSFDICGRQMTYLTIYQEGSEKDTDDYVNDPLKRYKHTWRWPARA